MTAYLRFQVLALSLIGLALYYGEPQRIWDADHTHVVGLIAAVTIGASLAGARRSTRAWLTWTVDNGLTLLLGLLGTVLGFMAAVEGMAASDVAAKMGGVATSNATTVAGLVCHLYLLALARVVK